MKKIIFFVMLLFLLVGAVSAVSDNNITDPLEVTDTSQDTISVDDTSDDPLKSTDEQEKYTEGNSTTGSITPTVTSSSVTGTPGKTITLKTTVKYKDTPIENATVVFKLNGKSYTTTTDANGVASVKVVCPASKALEPKYKTSSKKLTKTTKYSKTYSCTATVSGEGLNKITSKFKVTSKKTTVTKYKIIKKTKVVTITIKKKMNQYKKGTNVILVMYVKNKYGKRVGVIVGEKYHGFLKFQEKELIKEPGKKWKWTKWFKVKKGKMSTIDLDKTMKIKKVKVKYTQITYKKIK